MPSGQPTRREGRNRFAFDLRRIQAVDAGHSLRLLPARQLMPGIHVVRDTALPAPLLTPEVHP